MVTLEVVLDRVPEPEHVVVGADEDSMVTLAGTVSAKPAWVNANALLLLNVIVSVEAVFSVTLAGENASATVGAAGVTVSDAGHAVAAVPAEDGAPVAAPVDVKFTVATSVWPVESVTVRVRVPAVPLGMTVAWAELAPPMIVTPPLAVHA
jgi:hypothetical protein